jgi:hypothetical protein
MSLKNVSLLSLVACLLAACAPLGPLETSGDAAALPPFKTFRISEEQFVFATELSPEQSAKISRELRSAAVSALQKRGYKEVAENADMLVSLGAISRPTLSDDSGSSGNSQWHPVDTSTDPGRQFGPPGSGSEPMPAGAGREGDLMLNLIDPKTQRVVWGASANGAATTPSEALRHARATYAHMVEKLPKAQ